MFYKAVSVALVAVFLHGSMAAQDQPQSPAQAVAQMQQVLHKAQEKNKAVKVTLKKKIDNQKKFSGKVSDISDTGFVITDQKTGTTKRLAYEDVRQVNQAGMSRGAKIGIGIAVGIAVLAVVAVVATKPWRSE
jgi:RimP-like protein